MTTFMKWVMFGAVLVIGGQASAATRREACRDYTELSNSLRNLHELPSTAPVWQLRQAERSVAVSFHRFEKSAEPYAAPQVDSLGRSIRELDEATKNVPPNATPMEAHSIISGQVTKVEVAKNGVLQSLGCAEMR